MLDLLTKIPAFSQLLAAVGAKPRTTVEGVWGSSAALVTAGLSDALRRPILYLAAHIDEAEDAADDLRLFGVADVRVLPAPDSASVLDAERIADIQARRAGLLAGLIRGADRETERQRDGERERGRDGKAPGNPPVPQSLNPSVSPSPPLSVPPPLVVAPIAALIQSVPDPAALAAHSLDLRKGTDFPHEKLLRWLSDHAYERSEMIEGPGDFAQRGGIIDIFPLGAAEPVRVEFYDDRIESVRRINAADQHSLEDLPGVLLTALPPRSERVGEGTTSALTYFPPDTVIVLRDPAEIQEVGRAFVERLKSSVGMYTVEAVLRAAARFTIVELAAFGKGAAAEAVGMRFELLPAFAREAARVAADLREQSLTERVLVFCDAPAEEERVKALLAQTPERPETETRKDGETEGRRDGATRGRGDAGTSAFNPQSAIRNPKSEIEIHPGFLHTGFRIPDANAVLVGFHELFGRKGLPAARSTAQSRPIDSFLDLRAGDLVVHANHGIGRFKALQTVRRGSRAEEVLVIEYADKAAIQVPVDQINFVQKYVGGFKGAPLLNKLGGTAWAKQKQKVAEAVSDLALDLLAVGAERAARQKPPFPADTAWQKEFEAAFPYTETPDQLRGAAEIKKDLESPRPMDRLLCGDVGYGKTELAVRAAFKAAEFGKQVAVLVPTTVLAEQHDRTFKERMAGYPFVIESVSRFKTAGEQREVVANARAGRVDVLIGTHRLLSKDVMFADLGLLIIDEEQRFGVEHKERMKMLKKTVDVLTLTATPIPRTLHLSMLGLRDISSLTTPPADRRSIYTEVTRYDEEKIRHAIERELARGGQVFFVHNRVYDIATVADEILRIVPTARIGVGHGQMDEEQLEQVMLDFMNHKYDILVCTTIIESGLDIRNANTMFIHDADLFGLADLHQLRGRIGRFKHRAYCYMLLPQDRPITQTAQRRLKAIEDYSELGAGFRIAMRDLEIRGVGNILGAEQSGHIAGVGYDMYCQLLEEAVRKLKNTPPPKKYDVRVDLGVDMFLPKSYIESDRQRMEAYRKLTACSTLPDLAELAAELADRFGPLPAAAKAVIDLNELRILAGQWKIAAMVLHKPDVIFTVQDMSVLGPLFAKAPGVVRIADPQTVHLRMGERHLEPATLAALLRNMLRATPPV